jgi:hypothetical protein
MGKRILPAIVVLLWAMLAAEDSFAFMPVKGQVEADCAEILKSKKLMVALVFGQSNAGNFGNEPMEAAAGVYSFYRGRCYRAKDPLPGGDGSGGSIWSRLGSMLIESGVYEKIIFVPASKGATTVGDWGPDGRMHYLLKLALRDALASGFVFTHLLWQQGENDGFAGTGFEEYEESFILMLDTIREAGVKAPVYVAVSTRCLRLPVPEVRKALKNLPKLRPDILPGPDTDELGPAERYDGCHFNSEGLEKAARLWLNKLIPQKE